MRFGAASRSFGLSLPVLSPSKWSKRFRPVRAEVSKPRSRYPFGLRYRSLLSPHPFGLSLPVLSLSKWSKPWLKSSKGFIDESDAALSPAAATERHRNSSMNRLMEKEQGLDKLCAPCPELVKGSARSFDTSGRTEGKKAWTRSARTAKRKHQSSTTC